jgi:hypothetical protein
MPDEGLESFLCEPRPRLFGIFPGGKRANLNAVQVVVGVRVPGGHEEYRVATPFQNLHQGFGVLPRSRGRNLDRESGPRCPRPGSSRRPTRHRLFFHLCR